MEIEQADVLTRGELARGPDLLRPGTPRCVLDPLARTFISTKYADQHGNRWFSEPATVGHEKMIVRPDVLAALLGPGLGEMEPEIAYEREIYRTDPATGLLSQDDQGLVVVGRERAWDHYAIRRLTRETNLYGRAGHVRGRLVVMLWMACEGWEEKLDAVVGLLEASDDDVVTIDRSCQFLVRDYRAYRGRSR